MRLPFPGVHRLNNVAAKVPTHIPVDGRGPSTSPPKGRFGPTPRVMAKRIQEDVLLHVQMP